MSEQSGSGRYPKPPASDAWVGTDFNANDPNQGNFGSPFAEAAGKQSDTKAGFEEGQGIHVPKGGTGRTFSSEEMTNDVFEQGEIPSADIDYFGFKK